MKIITETSDQLVLKDGGAKDWFRLFNGTWAVLVTLVFAYMFFGSTINFSYNTLINTVGLLPVFVMILAIGMKFILWASWATLEVNKAQGQMVLSRKGVLGKKSQVFNISDIASIELTKLYQRQNKVSVLVHQIILDLKDGTKIPFGHESNESSMEKVGPALAQFISVPFQNVEIPLTKWGRKLPPYNKF